MLCNTGATNGSAIHFSPKMKPNELAQWLLQEYGEEYQAEINKLKSKQRIWGIQYYVVFRGGVDSWSKTIVTSRHFNPQLTESGHTTE